MLPLYKSYQEYNIRHLSGSNTKRYLSGLFFEEYKTFNGNDSS